MNLWEPVDVPGQEDAVCPFCLQRGLRVRPLVVGRENEKEQLSADYAVSCESCGALIATLVPYALAWAVRKRR